jgi:diacylglycerol O-acyltransferase
MDRLSGLDAEFLHLEDGAVHMAIAGACVFADPPPTIGEMEALMASKMHLIPRYRQRVRTVPFELGRPVWVDDPDFDLGYHMRHTALPAPGDDGDFCRLMGRLMSQDLDRDRPPWEIWLVEGLEGGRWALVFKVHHCMVDGIAGVGLLTAVLDFVPDAALGEPVPWTPAAEPPGAAKVLDAGADWPPRYSGPPGPSPARSSTRSGRSGRWPPSRPVPSGSPSAWHPPGRSRSRGRSAPTGSGPTRPLPWTR